MGILEISIIIKIIKIKIYGTYLSNKLVVRINYIPKYEYF